MRDDDPVYFEEFTQRVLRSTAQPLVKALYVALDPDAPLEWLRAVVQCAAETDAEDRLKKGSR